MGPKTFLAALMCLIIVAHMCSPFYLVWYGFTTDGSVIFRIVCIVTGLILLRLFKPISNLTGKDYKFFITLTDYEIFCKTNSQDQPPEVSRLANGVISVGNGVVSINLLK